MFFGIWEQFGCWDFCLTSHTALHIGYTQSRRCCVWCCCCWRCCCWHHCFWCEVLRCCLEASTDHRAWVITHFVQIRVPSGSSLAHPSGHPLYGSSLLGVLNTLWCQISFLGGCRICQYLTLNTMFRYIILHFKHPSKSHSATCSLSSGFQDTRPMCKCTCMKSTD